MKSEKIKEIEEILKLRKEFLDYEHKLKIERMAYDRESAKRFHDMALERERIKSAEIRKAHERKSWENFTTKSGKY